MDANWIPYDNYLVYKKMYQPYEGWLEIRHNSENEHSSTPPSRYPNTYVCYIAIPDDEDSAAYYEEFHELSKAVEYIEDFFSKSASEQIYLYEKG